MCVELGFNVILMYSQLPVKDLYKLHLLKQMEKTDQEMVFLGRKIRKTDLEIELLEHQLQVGAWSQMSVNCQNNI